MMEGSHVPPTPAGRPNSTTTSVGTINPGEPCLRLTKIPVEGNAGPVKANIPPITTAEDFASEVAASATALLGRPVAVSAVSLTVGAHQEARVTLQNRADTPKIAVGGTLTLRGWRSSVELMNAALPTARPGATAAATRAQPLRWMVQPAVDSTSPSLPPVDKPRHQPLDFDSCPPPPLPPPPVFTDAPTPCMFSEVLRHGDGESFRVAIVVDGKQHEQQAARCTEGSDIIVQFGSGGQQPQAPLTAPPGFAVVGCAGTAATAHKTTFAMLKSGVFSNCSIDENEARSPHSYMTIRLVSAANRQPREFALVVVTAPRGSEFTQGLRPSVHGTPAIVVALVPHRQVLVDSYGGPGVLQVCHVGNAGFELCAVIATATPVLPAGDGKRTTDSHGPRFFSTSVFPAASQPPFPPPPPIVVADISPNRPDPMRRATRAACLIVRHVKETWEAILAAGRNGYDLMAGNASPSSPATVPSDRNGIRRRVIDAALAGASDVLGPAALTPAARNVLFSAVTELAPPSKLLLEDGTLVFVVNAQQPSTFGLQNLPFRSGAHRDRLQHATERVRWCRCSDQHAAAGRGEASISPTLALLMEHKKTRHFFLFDNQRDHGGASSIEVPLTPTPGGPLNPDGNVHAPPSVDDAIAERRVIAATELAQRMLEKDRRAKLVPDAADIALEVVPKESETWTRLCVELQGTPVAIVRVAKSSVTQDVLSRFQQGVRSALRVYHTTSSEAAAVDIARNGPELSKASASGNSGAGFYTSQDVTISKGYGNGNSTLICLVLVGTSIKDIGRGALPAQHAKLRAKQAHSAKSIHAQETVVFHTDQVKVDYIAFWKDNENVAAIVNENNRLRQQAREASRDAKLLLADVDEEIGRLDSFIRMLDFIAASPAPPEEKASKLHCEELQFKNAPGIYRLKADIVNDAKHDFAYAGSGRTPLFELDCAAGSGKSLYVPQFLAFDVLPSVWRVLVLVPTRMIAEQVSRRAADLRTSALGTEIGFSIGGKKCVDLAGPGTTRIVYMTYMMFLKGELQTNPELQNIGAIIFDEAHKAQADVNVAVGLIPVVRKRCPRTMIFISSATLPRGLVASLGDSRYTRRFELSRRGFPVTDVSMPPDDDDEEHDTVKHMLKIVRHVLQQGTQGNLLCFLPTRKAVEEAAEALDNADDLPIFVEAVPIHAHLRPDDRDRIRHPLARGRRVIFATSYLDEGITAHDVTHVLDCGKTITERPCATPGKYEVHVQYITRATADQRRGRTGRTCPGQYIKLYRDNRLRNRRHAAGDAAAAADDDDDDLRDHDDTVELENAGRSLEWEDWLPTLLALGVGNPATLLFPHPPSHTALAAAVVRLHDLGLLDSASPRAQLTARGHIAAAMPFTTAHNCFILEAAAFLVEGTAHTTAWLPAAAAVAAIKVDRLSGRRLFASADVAEKLQAARDRDPPYRSDFAAIADVFTPLVNAVLANKRARLPQRATRGLSSQIDEELVHDLVTDVEHACTALHSGSPAAQQRLLADFLRRSCGTELEFGSRLSPLGRFAATAVASTAELRALLDSVGDWLPQIQHRVDFTVEDVRKLREVLPNTDGQQLVAINRGGGPVSYEEALRRAAVRVYRNNVAIPNNPSSLAVPCIVTNEALEMAMVDRNGFVQRDDLPPGAVVFFSRFEHWRSEKGDECTLLKLVTIGDEREALGASSIAVADQLMGVFHGDAAGNGEQLITAATNDSDGANPGRFARQIVLAAADCPNLAPVGTHASRKVRDPLTQELVPVWVFTNNSNAQFLTAAYSGAVLSAEAALTGALALSCKQMFPNLHAALVAPPAFPADGGPLQRVQDLWLHVIHVLVHYMGLVVYGGAVRDFLLRGDELNDIDVSASPAVAEMNAAEIVTTLETALAEYCGGKLAALELSVALAQQQKLPTVAAVVDVSVKGLNGLMTTQLEFVVPSQVPSTMDMSCNNVQVCHVGLRLKRRVAGATLALIIWQIRNKRGTVLDASETSYQQSRRRAMMKRGWKLWNVDPANANFNRNATAPPEITAHTLNWSTAE